MNTLKIFIVDDDEEDRELFAEVLLKISPYIQYETASNGNEALEMLRSYNEGNLPDYIFVDLNMPILNGKEFLIEVKKDLKLKHIPIIIYTTSSNNEDAQETKRLGASFFLTKPNRLNELTNAISYIIDGYKLKK